TRSGRSGSQIAGGGDQPHDHRTNPYCDFDPLFGVRYRYRNRSGGAWIYDPAGRLSWPLPGGISRRAAGRAGLLVDPRPHSLAVSGRARTAILAATYSSITPQASRSPASPAERVSSSGVESSRYRSGILAKLSGSE